MSGNKPGTKISLNRVIGNVIGNLGLTNVSADLDNFARWAFDAEMKIGTKLSKKKYECEIDVKDYQACLPDNFLGPKVIALKYGGEIIDVTFRDFVMFNKAPETGVSTGDQKFVGGNLQIVNPGVIQVMRVAFSGVWAAADTATITVVLNNCGNIVPHTFNYVVQGGDTIPTIVTELAQDINAIPNIGFTATASGSNLDITGANVGVSFTLTVYAGSTLGVMTSNMLQAHVPPTKSCGCNSTCSCSPAQINTGSNNLANRNAYEINTGASRQSAVGNIWGFFGHGNARVYSVTNGRIYLNFFKEGKIGIAYYGIWVDDDGWPLIEQGHETAVTTYCEYMYLRRESIKGKVAQGIYKDAETRWYWLCGQARGDDEMPNEQEMIYVSSVFNNFLSAARNKNFF